MTISPRFRFASAFALVLSVSSFCRAQDKKDDAKKPDAAASVKKEAPKKETTTEPAARADQGWWMKRHEAILDSVKEKDADLLMIGDSITEGWKGGGKAVWARHYGPRNAANLGIGGDRTQHVLWRLENGEIDGLHPKVAVVMIGTNNLGDNSNDQIIAGVKKIVCTLREKLPQTKILLLGIFPRQDRKTPEEVAKTLARIASINAQLAPLADGKTIRYLDIGYVFVEPSGVITKDIMPDLLHLTSVGYRRWADAIEPTLWTMMEE